MEAAHRAERMVEPPRPDPRRPSRGGDARQPPGSPATARPRWPAGRAPWMNCSPARSSPRAAEDASDPPCRPLLPSLEPDFNPRGSMIHLGNPKCRSTASWPSPSRGAHPRPSEGERVARRAAKYLRYKLAMNLGPGGAWTSCLPTRRQRAPRHAGGHRARAAPGGSTRRRRVSPPCRAFTLQLLAPGPALRRPHPPQLGHEASTCAPTGSSPPASCARSTPTGESPGLAWDQTGRPMRAAPRRRVRRASHPQRRLLSQDVGQASRCQQARCLLHFRRATCRRSWPASGCRLRAVLRAHAGDPNETFLAIRQGYLTSHCDV